MRIFFVVLMLLVWPICIESDVLGQNTIIISKAETKLLVVDSNADTLFSCAVALGKCFGQKRKAGDMKTPEGRFAIAEICNSSKWKHDFRDGRGMVDAAYGPYFIRLIVPGFKGIGIHGTCFPESIGKRETEGCIRLENRDLITLIGIISIKDFVIILPDPIVFD